MKRSIAMYTTAATTLMIFTNNVMAITTTDPIAIPEPSSFVLFGLGIATLAFSRRKNQTQKNK